MKATATWHAAMASDTGRQRTTNEDRLYMDETAGVFLVVDGVGGHAAGEKAAEMAASIIAEHLSITAGSAEERVRTAITRANNEIYQLSQTNEEWRGMACVLTLAVAHDDMITVGHVGDSRLYLVWNGTVKKVTSDHSPVGEREDQGELTELEAMGHPQRNEVFRDVGSRPHQPPDRDFIEIKSFPFHPEAAILLCSDGLSDLLTSSEISSIADHYAGDPAVIAQALVNAANEAGGKDNISVIFVAGPEFLGSASRPMTEARTRHAITRMRSGSSRFRVLGRVVWLVVGMVLGAIAWNLIERNMLERKFANPAPVNRAETIPHGARLLADPRSLQSLTNALKAARPGDTIEIPAGLYPDPVYLNNGIVLTVGPPSAEPAHPPVRKPN